MFCIICGSDTNVTNSRSGKKNPSVWRRRNCSNCKNTFTTREKPELSLEIKVKKRSGKFEAFSEDILLISIINSLSHRKDRVRLARELTDTILAKVIPLNEPVIESKTIYESAYTVIKRFDSAAAVFYKSHHSK